MKIIAVGMNYALHNKELGHTHENKEPVIFLKPDSAILKDGKPFFIPDFSNEVHYETEVVVRICRLGKNIAPRFAHRYYDALISLRVTCNVSSVKPVIRGNSAKVSTIRQPSAPSSRWSRRVETCKIWTSI